MIQHVLIFLLFTMTLGVPKPNPAPKPKPQPKAAPAPKAAARWQWVDDSNMDYMNYYEGQAHSEMERGPGDGAGESGGQYNNKDHQRMMVNLMFRIKSNF